MEKITLELTQDEAELVLDVLLLVGGSPEFSRRQFADSVANKLFDAGFPYIEERVKTIDGTLYCDSDYDRFHNGGVTDAEM
jgi:hypothetical protein